MTDTVREQIADLIVSKLAAGISGVDVYRATDGPGVEEVDADSIEVRQLPGDPQFSLFDAYACRDEYDIVVAVLDDSASSVQARLGQVAAVCENNILWNDGSTNLATLSWTGQPEVHETEVDERVRTGVIRLTVLSYVRRSDPTSVKVIG